MIGDREGRRLGSIEQSVFEQDRSGAMDQLAEGREGVAQAEG